MSVSDLVRTRADLPALDNPEAALARYKQLRQVSRRINDKLVRRLSKDVIHEGARKLGMLEGNSIVLDTEDESAVLMDYCIHEVRPGGRNAFQDYLSSCSTDSESDEATCLRALQNAIYSVFRIQAVLPGLGIGVEDMRTSAVYIVIDSGFALTGEVGMFFASRLLLHDRFAMTAGAALPIGFAPPGEEEDFMGQVSDFLELEDGVRFDPARVIRACRSMGASSNVRYIEPTGKIGGQTRLTMSQPQAQIEPYDPCPCGSGKKFKFCCRKKG